LIRNDSGDLGLGWTKTGFEDMNWSELPSVYFCIDGDEGWNFITRNARAVE
jgi:hypothetical protein